MLERLVLRDFQGHEKRTLDFSPGLTVLVGDSRKGKSACFRALRWLCQGGPSAGFVRHGRQGFKVVLRADRHRVSRIKSTSQNTYQVDDGEPFRAVKASVPQDVVELLSVSDINFQGQLDPPFWLSLTPGDAARELNKVMSLDLIDETLARISSGLRRANAREEAAHARLEQCQQKSQSLGWVPDAERAWLEVEEASDLLAQTALEVTELESAAEEIRRLCESVGDCDDLVREMESLVGASESLKEVTEEVEELQRASEAISRLIEEKSKSQRAADEVEGELAQMRAKQCPLCGRQ